MASTGSFFAAEEEGIRPAMKVNNTLININAKIDQTGKMAISY